MQKILFLSLAITVFSACQKDMPAEVFIASQKSYDNVDKQLWPYYEEFEAQAALRGIEINLNEAGVTGVIEELNPDGVAGQCTYSTHIADVAIDISFWNSTSSNYLREMVVFHELGHCYLHRGHEEGVLPNGTCGSIMRSGLEGCRDNYHAQTREAYLDELFAHPL